MQTRCWRPTPTASPNGTARWTPARPEFARRALTPSLSPPGRGRVIASGSRFDRSRRLSRRAGFGVSVLDEADRLEHALHGRHVAAVVVLDRRHPEEQRQPAAALGRAEGTAVHQAVV